MHFYTTRHEVLTLFSRAENVYLLTNKQKNRKDPHEKAWEETKWKDRSGEGVSRQEWGKQERRGAELNLPGNTSMLFQL